MSEKCAIKSGMSFFPPKDRNISHIFLIRVIVARERKMYHTQHQSKRKHYDHNLEEYGQEEVVDDLAVAASFALITSPVQEPHREKEQYDEDEDDDSEEESTESSSDNSTDTEDEDQLDETSDKVNEKHDAIADQSSDDESDIDLSEQLAKMKDDDASDDGGGGGGRGRKKSGTQSYKPTTQNEIDLYSCPISDLKEKLNMDLDIDDSKNTILFQPSLLPGVLVGIVPSTRINVAGHVKTHLVNERTIVVQSKTMDGMKMMSNNPNTQQQPLLLDEGNLLLLKLNENDENVPKIINDMSNISTDNVRVVALGKILEVFGPVSKPLYTVRLKHSIIDEKVPSSSKPEGIHDDFQSDEKDTNNTIGEESDIPSDKPLSIEHKTTPKSNDNTHTETFTDPWAEDGVFTKWLIACPSMEIYYSADQVKVVDTHTVAMNSKKGCDASNVYDEEVTDIHEMYFSDDEAEREMKNKKKGNRNNRGARDASGPTRNLMNTTTATSSSSSSSPMNQPSNSYFHGSNKQQMTVQYQNQPPYHSNPSFGYQQPHQVHHNPQPYQSYGMSGAIPPSYTQGFPQYQQQPHYGYQYPPGAPPTSYPTPYHPMQMPQPNQQQQQYGVPPPPPPPPSHFPGSFPPYPPPQGWNTTTTQQGQHIYPQYQNGTTQSPNEGQTNRNDGDTVYYNYSGS